MQIVIELSEEDFEKNKNARCDYHTLRMAIKNGTPLPKGHGRIADMDAAIKCIEEVEGEDAVWAISLIEWACSKRTIIEADRKWGIKYD